MKQLMAGLGLILLAIILVPVLVKYDRPLVTPTIGGDE